MEIILELGTTVTISGKYQNLLLAPAYEVTAAGAAAALLGPHTHT